MGLADEMDAVYFTSLDDMSLNGNESRYSGTRIQFDILGKLLCNFVKTKTEDYVPDSEIFVTENSTKYYNNLWVLELLYDSYKPLGLKWQRYFSANLYFSRYYPDMDEYSLARDYKTCTGFVG